MRRPPDELPAITAAYDLALEITERVRSFAGWTVFADHRRLRRPTGVRMQRGMRGLAAATAEGEVSWGHVQAVMSSWLGHLRHGDAWGLRTALLEGVVFARDRGEGMR